MQNHRACGEHDERFGVGHGTRHHDPRGHQEDQSGGGIFVVQQAGRVDHQNRAQHLRCQPRHIVGSAREGVQMKEGAFGSAGQS